MNATFLHFVSLLPAAHSSIFPHIFLMSLLDLKCTTTCLCPEMTPSPLQGAVGCRALQLVGGDKEVTMVRKEQTRSLTP